MTTPTIPEHGMQGDAGLLPCPFCGGQAEWREFDHRHPDDIYGLVVDHAEGCFLALHMHSDDFVTRWNTRTRSA